MPAYKFYRRRAPARSFTRKRTYGRFAKGAVRLRKRTFVNRAFRRRPAATGAGKTEWKISANDSTMRFEDRNNVANGVTLNGVEEGTAVYERIGRQVNSKVLQLRYRILESSDGTTAISGGEHCIAVVLDKHPGSTQPLWSEVFQDIKNDGTTASSVQSGVNLDNRDRFVVLWRKLSQTGNVAALASNYQIGVLNQDGNTAAMRGYKTLNVPMCITYKGSTNTLSSISSNAIYLMTQTTTASNNSNLAYWNLDYEYRWRYTDK